MHSSIEQCKKMNVHYFSKFLDVFEAIDRKIHNGGTKFEVFTVGNQVKSEVKEEMLIKAEKGERRKAFIKFLDMVSPVCVEIYEIIIMIRTALMETVGEVQENDKRDLETIELTMKNNFSKMEGAMGELLLTNFSF